MMLTDPRLGLAAFNRDDRGVTVVETLVVFAPLMALVFTNIEIIMAFYAVNAAEKAAQAASRLAATQSSIYVGSDMYNAATGMPRPNVLNPVYADTGPACFQPNGVAGCLPPDDTGWVCTGATVNDDIDCDADRFGMLVTELQRFYPSVDCDDVTITYRYAELGVAGGPLIPEIQVSIAPRSLPVNLPSLLGFATLGADGQGIGTSVSASLGEDLRSALAAPSGFVCS
ncbi:MAG: TadE/TadG family type IV pilus assembly protein [Pseudomonadota bacterium]